MADSGKGTLILPLFLQSALFIFVDCGLAYYIVVIAVWNDSSHMSSSLLCQLHDS